VSVVVVALIIGATFVANARRLLDAKQAPLVGWFGLLAAAALPCWMAYCVLVPGETVDSAEVGGLHTTASVQVPVDHALLVTATLNEDEDVADAGRTSYTLAVNGTDWHQTLTGTIRRKSAGGGPDVDLLDGDAIRESGRRRKGAWGEDLEERYDLEGTGTIQVEVTNWEGEAAQALFLQVIPAPPKNGLLWSLAGILTIFGIWIEVRARADKFAGDLAFLALYGVFLRDGVTPSDDFQPVAMAILPAALLGWGVGGGLAWIFVRSSRNQARAEAKETDD
jgi:hypothetical protein